LFDPPTTLGVAVAVADPTPTDIPTLLPPPVPAITPTAVASKTAMPTPNEPAHTFVPSKSDVWDPTKPTIPAEPGQPPAASNPGDPHDPQPAPIAPSNPVESSGTDNANPHGGDPGQQIVPGITIGPSIVMPDPSKPSGLLVGAVQTMTPGVIYSSGQLTVSFTQDGSGGSLAIISGSNTQIIPMPSGVTNEQTPSTQNGVGALVPVMTIGGLTFYVDPSIPDRLVVQNNQEPFQLSPGETTNIGGTSISVMQDGTLVLVDPVSGFRSTIRLPAMQGTAVDSLYATDRVPNRVGLSLTANEDDDPSSTPANLMSNGKITSSFINPPISTNVPINSKSDASANAGTSSTSTRSEGRSMRRNTLVAPLLVWLFTIMYIS
jgi:hypothetical protein